MTSKNAHAHAPAWERATNHTAYIETRLSRTCSACLHASLYRVVRRADASHRRYYWTCPRCGETSLHGRCDGAVETLLSVTPAVLIVLHLPEHDDD